YYRMIQMEGCLVNYWLQERIFKSGLVGYLADDDDDIFVIVEDARRRKLEAWLKACCLFIISSKIQGSVLFKFYYFHYISIPYCTIGTLYKSSGGNGSRIIT
ncbi:hypothetical protein Tco_1276019, partial [Tanacetum coccineum]